MLYLLLINTTPWEPFS